MTRDSLFPSDKRFKVTDGDIIRQPYRSKYKNVYVSAAN